MALTYPTPASFILHGFRMTTRRFVTTVLVAVLLIAAALVLAELLDAPWLRIVAVVLLVVIFIARETWQWWGAGRQWLAVNGALIGVIALAFVTQRLAS
jgi:general stress protein CsbA